MNKLIPSTEPIRHKYQRIVLTDELIEQLAMHSKMGVQALAKKLGVSQAAVIKYRRLKKVA